MLLTYTHPMLMIFGLLAMAGLIRMGRSRGRGLTAIGVAGLILLAWPPVDWLGSRALEGWYPVRPFEPPAGMQAIVVFSEAVLDPVYERPYPLPGERTVDRCEYAAWIYRRRPAPVLACGGRFDPRYPPFSATMRKLLEGAGVPAENIWTEERSRNTHENALYGASILRLHGVARVALVADARSMPRAAAALARQGITVTPAPCRFRTWDGWHELLPGWEAIRGNEDTLHEMLGLAWYRLRGWI